MMLWKNRNKKVGFCVMVVTSCLFLAVLWAVLATPETALADKPDKPDNPGGNVDKQDIPGKLTLTGDNLKSDDPPLPYSNSDAGTTSFIGRRRSIWVTLSKNSPRSMNLELGNVDQVDGDPVIGADPWGVPVMTPAEVQDLGLPSVSISQVDLHIAPYLNVSGLGDEYLGENFPYCEDITEDDGHDYNTMHASTWLIFLDDAGKQWEIYFGPGRMTEVEWGEWGGGRIFTRRDATPVKIQRINPDEEDPKIWKADSQSTPGFLWYRGSKKNAPYVFVGKYSVPWSCTVESLP